MGEEITFTVEKVMKNSKTEGTGKEGNKFNIGLKTKDGDLLRRDVHTEAGEIYTIGSWEVYYKL